MKVCKRSYAAESVNIQKVQKPVFVLDGKLSLKSSARLSAKYLEDKLCKIKKLQKISVALRSILNQLKISEKRVTLKWTPLKLLYLKF